jgi:uncharacterized membrane protein YdjX (TVP38/TMEM64 family)
MGAAYFLGLEKYVTFETLKDHHSTLKFFVSEHPLITPLLYICLYIAMSALSIPGGALLSVTGGFLFGQPWSTVYVVLGATVGSSIIFLAAKTALGELLFKKAGPLLTKMQKGFERHAVSYLFFLRLVPLFPFWAVNLAPAFFGVRFRTYFWTTFLGIIPGTFVFTQAGTGLSSILEKGEAFSIETVFNWQIRIALIALALFSLLPIIIKKLKYKNHRPH